MHFTTLDVIYNQLGNFQKIAKPVSTPIDYHLTWEWDSGMDGLTWFVIRLKILDSFYWGIIDT